MSKILSFCLGIFVVFLINQNSSGKEGISLKTFESEIQVHLAQVEDLKKQQDIKEALVKQVYHEAKGEPIKGQIATMFVPESRLESGRFPAEDLVEIVYQENPKRIGKPCEFDWVCDKKPDSVPKRAYQKISKLVDAYFAGKIKNPCPEAVFYYNPKTVSAKPAWAFPDTLVCRIGNHDFHRALPWKEYKTRLASL